MELFPERSVPRNGAVEVKVGDVHDRVTLQRRLQAWDDEQLAPYSQDRILASSLVIYFYNLRSYSTSIKAGK